MRTTAQTRETHHIAVQTTANATNPVGFDDEPSRLEPMQNPRMRLDPASAFAQPRSIPLFLRTGSAVGAMTNLIRSRATAPRGVRELTPATMTA